MKEIFLKVYLQPKSSRNEIVGPYRDGIKVRVTPPPVEGKANQALIRLLAKELRIAPPCIEIIQGHHSREKIIRISHSNAMTLQLRPSPALEGRDRGAFRVNPERPAKPSARAQTVEPKG